MAASGLVAPAERRRDRRLGTGLLGLALLLFALFSSYGFTGPFYYGHYGYHGGSYAAWARGTLRHQTIYPVNEPGFAKPNPQTFYVHHPMLTHQLVTFTFFVFGEHEWSVRLAALLPSTASLLLVAALAWRYLGPLAGGAAALVFAFVPVNIWYGTHIDQGFPSIAFLLAFFWFYLRWLENGRWRTALTALGCQALAGCFEWSPYFAFPVIFTHVLVTGWRRRGRYAAFLGLHPLTVILPLSMHFALVWRAGLLEDLFAAYRTRTSPIAYRAFIARMAEYGDTLFGRALLVAMAVWLLLAFIRLISGRARAVDLVGLTFAFALVSYMHVFKNAVVTHAYRQLYGNVWAGLAVADLTMRAQRLGRWLWVNRRPAWASRGGLVTAIGVPIVVTALTLPTSWAGLMESRLHGGVPGWSVFDPDLRQTAFAIEVARMTTPQDKLYFYPSFTWTPPHRMDWAFYYDRDPRRGRSLRALVSLTPEERKHAVAIFFQSALYGDERRAFAELASRHPLLQVGDLTALDLRVESARLLAYRLAPETAARGGRARQWLVGPYPFPTLALDPASRDRVGNELKEILRPPQPINPAVLARPPALVTSASRPPPNSAQGSPPKQAKQRKAPKQAKQK